eukprot:jgi/Tetstr1/421803/TSEL_012706.t1
MSSERYRLPNGRRLPQARPTTAGASSRSAAESITAVGSVEQRVEGLREDTEPPTASPTSSTARPYDRRYRPVPRVDFAVPPAPPARAVGYPPRPGGGSVGGAQLSGGPPGRPPDQPAPPSPQSHLARYDRRYRPLPRGAAPLPCNSGPGPAAVGDSAGWMEWPGQACVEQRKEAPRWEEAICAAPDASQILPPAKPTSGPPQHNEEEEEKDAEALWNWEPEAASRPPPRRRRLPEGTARPARKAAASSQRRSPPSRRSEAPTEAAVTARLRALVEPEDPGALALNHNGVAVQVPGALNRHLRPYQRDGVVFLFKKYAEGKGGVLADDMGLGKTVQAIAFITAVILGMARDAGSSEKGLRPVLVMVPSSVSANWCRELEQWSGGYFQVVTIHGANKERSIAAIRSGAAQVAVVTYHVWRTLDEAGNGLHTIPWELAIYDEAHTLKNEKTKIYLSAAKIGTKRRYGLTGTVMPNCYEELWCLMSFMAPGCLGPLDSFTEYYAKRIKIGQRSDARPAEVEESTERGNQLTALLHKHLLRRTKDDTIRDQLPQKTDNIVLCRLSPMQLRAYQRLLASPDFQLLIRMYDDCDCGSGMYRKSCCHWSAPREEGGVLWPQLHCCTCPNAADPFTNPQGCKRHKPEGCPTETKRTGCPACLMGPCISLLQKVSNHLELVKADPQRVAGDAAALARAEEQAALVLGDDAPALGGLCADRGFLASSDTAHCGKMAALKQLMARWAGERAGGGGDAPKVLLFSYSTRMLDILESLMTRCGYSYIRLDGTTIQEDRQKRVDHFNNSDSCFVFLVSTRAGGLGLNLTAANKVVLFDPHWNPASDLQAQDRAFRIGQKRDVNVYRLVSLGTLEELVYNRQVYKQQQSDRTVMGADETRYFRGVQPKKGHSSDAPGELWGILNMLQLSADRVASQSIQQAAQVAEAEYLVQRFEANDAGVMETPEMLKLVELFSAADELGAEELAEKVEAIMAQGQGGVGLSGAAAESSEAGCLAAGGGVAHIINHQSLLGGRKQKRQRAARRGARERTPEEEDAAQHSTREPRTKVAAALPEGSAAGSPAARALRSLADWAGVGLAEMAARLLAMGEAGRSDVRRQYGADYVQGVERR